MPSLGKAYVARGMLDVLYFLSWCTCCTRPSNCSYVEYQRKQRMVVRLHREALQAMCNFWCVT